MDRAETLDDDVLEALIDYQSEYDWDELERAPLPPAGTPAHFFVHTRTVNEVALGTSWAANGRSAKKKADRIVESSDLWKKRTFPFGYAGVRPPERLAALLTLGDDDPIPQSSIIHSPYQRIPPYTYCARTSTNWRTDRPLETRCSLSFIPFFGEDNYQDEDEFKERLVESNVMLSFYIPNEDEVDEPKAEPQTAICGICLSVGCIVHHPAPAVPQPEPSKEDAANESALLPSNSRFFRVKQRERQQGCGPDCVNRRLNNDGHDDSDTEIVPLEDWTKLDKEEYDLVVTALGNDATSCTIAGYMSSMTCRDVYGALRAESRSSADSIGIPVTKRQKTLHESHHEADFRKWAPAEPTEEFSELELRRREPRVVLPWSPCYHPGRSCTSFTGKEDPRQGSFCNCKRHGTWCEPGCGCPNDCTERFKGCDCAANGGTCREPRDTEQGRATNGCPCVEHGRECQPDLCANHNTEKPCRASSVKADKALRTFVGSSELEGWGLFVGEDAHLSRVYIGDYRGEVINEHEANYRSLLYQTRQRSFLFDIYRSGVVDGVRLGNKVRYMNTASANMKNSAKNNCRGASCMINGETRIVIHASRMDGRQRFLKNDELLLDYGGNFELFED